jgi:hypothetical protein
MKTVKLGQKNEDSGMPMEVSAEGEKGKEHFPSAYLTHKDLPKHKVGDKVVLHGKVTSFEEGERENSDGEKKKHRHMEVELHELHTGANDEKEPKESDEDEIEKGMKEAENPKKEKSTSQPDEEEI